LWLTVAVFPPLYYKPSGFEFRSSGSIHIVIIGASLIGQMIAFAGAGRMSERMMWWSCHRSALLHGPITATRGFVVPAYAALWFRRCSILGRSALRFRPEWPRHLSSYRNVVSFLLVSCTFHSD
jgi:hypothetical protein